MHLLTFSIVLGAIIFVIFYEGITSVPSSSQEEGDLIIAPAPENVVVMTGEASWSHEVEKLTPQKIIQDSDLVAIVEIKSKGTTYSQYPHLPFTLFQAKVVRKIKGELLGDEIEVLIREGYIKENWYVRAEGDPELELGTKWLLFMNRMEYERSFDLKLPENTYRPYAPTSIMIEDEKLSVVFRDLVSGLNVLHGMTVTEFETKITN